MVKQDELNEAIKRAAAEHILKRQSQHMGGDAKSNNGSQVKPQFAQQQTKPGSAQAVKNELERALENRLRKQQLSEQQQQQSVDTVPPKQSDTELVQLASSSQVVVVNKRNVPRDPPPPIPIDNVATSTDLISTVIVQANSATTNQNQAPTRLG